MALKDEHLGVRALLVVAHQLAACLFRRRRLRDQGGSSAQRVRSSSAVEARGGGGRRTICWIAVRELSGPSKPREDWQPRPNRIIDLDEHDQGDPERHVDKTRKGPDRVERLGDENTPLDCAPTASPCASFLDELSSLRRDPDPCGVETCAEDNDVDPIDKESGPIRRGNRPGAWLRTAAP